MCTFARLHADIAEYTPKYLVDLLDAVYDQGVEDDPDWGVHMWSSPIVYAVADILIFASKKQCKIKKNIIDAAIKGSRADDGWEPLPDEWYDSLRPLIQV